MAWPVTEQSAKAELLSNFAYLNGDKYLDDFAKIGCFLASSEKVKAGLNLIEKDLTAAVFGFEGARELDRALSRRSVTNSEVMRKTRDAQKYFQAWNERLPENLAPGQTREELTDERFAHLVTKEFGALELQGGFWTSNDDNDPSDPPYKVMLMTPLSGKGFLKNLSHGRPWKDIVGPNHGEYTHRLQWCILIRGHHVEE
ncbi:MAG TPA: hypothetical protein VJ728_13300, partial [Candidatus Binataceae bacterium]|nr:hypothetical protein [Candidatus Binataceae bacterium]